MGHRSFADSVLPGEKKHGRDAFVREPFLHRRPKSLKVMLERGFGDGKQASGHASPFQAGFEFLFKFCEDERGQLFGSLFQV